VKESLNIQSFRSEGIAAVARDDSGDPHPHIADPGMLQTVGVAVDIQESWRTRPPAGIDDLCSGQGLLRTAVILPSFMQTDRMASRLLAGSITRPPVMTRSQPPSIGTVEGFHYSLHSFSPSYRLKRA